MNIKGNISAVFVVKNYFYIYKKYEFCYDVSGVSERYLSSPLILSVDFYCVINKLIIFISDSH
jgi:hypothetical protein